MKTDLELTAAKSALAVGLRERHLLVRGPNGYGQVALIREVLRQRNEADPLAFAAHAGLEISELVGRIEMRAGPGGSPEQSWIDGPLYQAMRQGRRLLINDVELLSPAVLDVLESVIRYGRIAADPQTGRPGRLVSPGFGVVALATTTWWRLLEIFRWRVVSF